MDDVVKKPRGFAAMTPEKRSQIARMGGSSVPPEKRAYAVNRALAAKAGSKGGKASRPEKRSFKMDPELAAKAGRLSAKSRAAAKEKK